MTLLFGLVLLVGAGILAFGAARTGVVEQRIANNEEAAIEAQQAAQAGLEYALAWLAERVWTADSEELTPPEIRSASGHVFQVELGLNRETNAVCAQSRARSAQDPDLTAVTWECFAQSGLFESTPDSRMPPPWVLAGCMAEPREPAEVFLLNTSSIAATSGTGTDASCLPRGQTETTTWTDREPNRLLTPDEKGASVPFRRAHFTGCPASQCAWDQVFALPLDEAKAIAEGAGHVFSNGIPCGAPDAPGLYLIHRSDRIEAAHLSGDCRDDNGLPSHGIGAPDQPVVLIVPSSHGCPAFMPDIHIHGIVYYESPTACAAQGWGGARIQGAVIWEGDSQAPAGGSVFIETDHGRGSELNAAFQVITGAARVPGTWRDWD